MGTFSDAEVAYLEEQRLGRLATVGSDGMPHVVPVAFRYNPDADTIDIGGRQMGQTKKYRDVARTGRAAFVVDDVRPPWRPRMIEIRGEAEALPAGGQTVMERFSPELIRLHPRRVISWGLEEGAGAARTV